MPGRTEKHSDDQVKFILRSKGLPEGSGLPKLSTEMIAETYKSHFTQPKHKEDIEKKIKYIVEQYTLNDAGQVIKKRYRQNQNTANEAPPVAAPVAAAGVAADGSAPAGPAAASMLDLAVAGNVNAQTAMAETYSSLPIPDFTDMPTVANDYVSGGAVTTSADDGFDALGAPGHPDMSFQNDFLPGFANNLSGYIPGMQGNVYFNSDMGMNNNPDDNPQQIGWGYFLSMPSPNGMDYASN